MGLSLDAADLLRDSWNIFGCVGTVQRNYWPHLVGQCNRVEKLRFE
jgi:hypothetical protein